RQRAGNDSIERAWPRETPELNGLKEQRGSVVESGDVGPCQSVSQTNARKREFAQGVAGENRETGAVLIVILDELRIEADLLPQQKRFLFRLVVAVAAGE